MGGTFQRRMHRWHLHWSLGYLIPHDALWSEANRPLYHKDVCTQQAGFAVHITGGVLREPAATDTGGDGSPPAPGSQGGFCLGSHLHGPTPPIAQSPHATRVGALSGVRFPAGRVAGFGQGSTPLVMQPGGQKVGQLPHPQKSCPTVSCL